MRSLSARHAHRLCAHRLFPLCAFPLAWLLVASPARAEPEVDLDRPAPSTAPVTAASVERQLHLVHTGGTSGLSSRSFTGQSILLLWDYLSAHRGSSAIERTGITFRKDRRFLFEEKSLLRSPLVKLLAAKAEKPRVLVEKLPVLRSHHILVFQYPPVPGFDLLALMEEQNRKVALDPPLRRTTARLLEHRAPSGERILSLDFDEPGSKDLPRDPLTWESWFVSRGTAELAGRHATYYMINQPRGYGPRRFRYLQDLRRATPSGEMLLVSSGNEVDTFDNLTGERGAFRDLDFWALAKLGYTAIVPGEDELHYGLTDLRAQARKHRLPLVGTNLEWAKDNKKGETVFPRYLLRRQNGVEVAILGLVDPEVADRIRDRISLAEVRLGDPLTAVTRVLDELRARPGSRPPLILVLGNLRGEAKAEFLARAGGFEVYLDHRFGQGHYPTEEIYQTGQRWRESQGQQLPVLVGNIPQTRVAEVRADFTRIDGELRLVRLQHTQVPISADLPRSDWLHRQIMADELKDLKTIESVLMPSIEEIIEGDPALLKMVREDPEIVRWLSLARTEKWQLWFTPRIWSQLVVNLLRDAAGTEVALIREVPRLPTSTPGPVREEYVLGWASSEEAVTRYELTGRQLRQLAELELTGVAQTGVDPESLLVGGRRIVDKEQYSVVLGNTVAELPGVARILHDVVGQSHFRLEGGRLISCRRGQTVRLRQVILASLRERRRRDPGFSAAYRARLRTFLLPQGNALVPRWAFRAEEITFSFTNTANYPRASWARNPGVRETRVVTPGNYVLGLKGALSTVYDSAALAWETRAQFAYARLVMSLEEIGGQPNDQKTADDVVASTELRLKLLDLPLRRGGRLNLIPYTNLTFDSEFTPTTNQLDRSVYPHQKDLYLYAGLVAFPGPHLEEVRLAGVMRTDFAASQGPVDGGILVGAKLSFPLWLARLKLGATFRYFAPTASDTEDKLGMIFQGTAKLMVPIAAEISASFGADLFLYRPKVDHGLDLFRNPTERGTAANLILDAGLAFDHLWKIY